MCKEMGVLSPDERRLAHFRERMLAHLRQEATYPHQAELELTGDVNGFTVGTEWEFGGEAFRIKAVKGNNIFVVEIVKEETE